jgi:long-chain acyl-CoA synthetase
MSLEADLGEALRTDYFLLREEFTPAQLMYLERTRAFVHDEVLPVINGYWERAEFPWPLIAKLGATGLVGDGIEGYGCPEMDPLSAGLVTMELHRGDGSRGAGPAWRQRHPAGLPRDPAHGRHRGHPHLRGHRDHPEPHRRARHHWRVGVHHISNPRRSVIIMTNLALDLREAAQMYPGRPAIRLDATTLSYAELDDLSARAAGWLRQAHHLRPGDRVGIMTPNVPQFPVFYYGVLRAGGIVVPMNPLLKAREVAHYLGDSGARLVIAWESAASEASAGAATAGATTGGTAAVTIGPATLGEAAASPSWPEVIPRADDDTAVILYTSGTTGTPKGAELTHANLHRNASVTATSLLSLGPQDVVMGCLPLFHSFGQTCGLNAAVLSGACLTLISRFSAATALQVIGRDRVTVFEGVPTMYVALLHEAVSSGTGTTVTDVDTTSLRLCVSGGAALPVEVLHGFEKRFGTVILEGYGLSETSPVATFNRSERRRPGSIGVPIEGVELRLVGAGEGEVTQPGEVGELAIRGHNVMKGYWNRPDATAAVTRDGWFRTGDLARVDEDGFYYIVDRKKDMIIRGGYNVYPREIEEVLYEHPAVLEAAVVGVPHPALGEEVGAAVSLRPGMSASPEDLREHVRQRVAAYKYPRHVWLVDELPKGPTGKVLKRAIVIPSDTAKGAQS